MDIVWNVDTRLGCAIYEECSRYLSVGETCLAQTTKSHKTHLHTHTSQARTHTHTRTHLAHLTPIEQQHVFISNIYLMPV